MKAADPGGSSAALALSLRVGDVFELDGLGESRSMKPGSAASAFWTPDPFFMRFVRTLLGESRSMKPADPGGSSWLLADIVAPYSAARVLGIKGEAESPR